MRTLTFYDTTLRDGAQTQGVDMTVAQKQKLAAWLDDFGFPYVEGGWPGANPTDDGFFAALPPLKQTRLTAFGMTRRAGVTVANDTGLQTLLKSQAHAVCLVGKSWKKQAEEALGVSAHENLDMIATSLAAVAAVGKEPLFDAEHFFDGYKADSSYAKACLAAALTGQDPWLVLCDTNGGTLPHEIETIVADVRASFPEAKLGFHGHNDCGLAVANSVAAVRAGCNMVQGTLNGLGERCGNADLVTLVPLLTYKMGYATGFDDVHLRKLKTLSENFDRLLDRDSNQRAPFVGLSAFAHKGGLHASAVSKNPSFYEHMKPEAVGNKRHVLMSKQAGRANLLALLEELHFPYEGKQPLLNALLATTKEREEKGYAYDRALASFGVLAMRKLYGLKVPFVLKKYEVVNTGGLNGDGAKLAASRASVSVWIDGETISACHEGNGPVNALDMALRAALAVRLPDLAAIQLKDYVVRILDGASATAAVTRVFVDTEDPATQQRWTSMGVSTDIVRASLEALSDAYAFHLCRKSIGR